MGGDVTSSHSQNLGFLCFAAALPLLWLAKDEGSTIYFTFITLLLYVYHGIAILCSTTVCSLAFDRRCRSDKSQHKTAVVQASISLLLILVDKQKKLTEIGR